MATTVYVKNIGAVTEDKEIREFFSFCGKIASFEITASGDHKDATITFEKETAARTALLLHNTSLGGNQISVTSPTTTDASPEPVDRAANSSPTLTQEEKPRARILAEVLAHGYLVAETSLQKAIALDEQHGISARFLNTLKQLDERTHATDHARAADATYSLSQRATSLSCSLLTGLGSYFEKASHTPTGKRIVDFYTTGQRQVQDVHNEARRLAELKKEEAGGDLYKATGLDRVLGRFGAGGGEKDKEHGTAAATGEAVPGGAPAHAAATESEQKPVKESGTGNPEVIH